MNEALTWLSKNHEEIVRGLADLVAIPSISTDGEHDAGQQLDQKIADGDRRGAIGAFPAQVKPGHQRHIQIPGDGVIAVRAMRGRADNAFVPRHPVDADIEKAADHAAKTKKYERPEVKRDACPDFGIKHGVESSRSKVPSPKVSNARLRAVNLKH